MVGLEKVGELELKGRLVRIVLDPQSRDPVRMFLFTEDLIKLFGERLQWCNVFRDGDPK